MDEYTKHAADFLAKHNLTFRAVYVDTVESDIMPHRYANKYRCTISGKGRGKVSFLFTDSIASTEAGEEPTAYDLLACIQKYDCGSFEDFCSEFGYDTDSRKAHKTWLAVVNEWRKVQRFFTPAEIEEMQEIS